ncbi:DUF4145 domain-containing protein [Methylobacterium sp. J-077]|uniref:DUF4145 domain-containing protein n=1 Tax=Methylobacterium sp. J-077 TaxID=2836656 RepID=UPI001FB8EAF1|nr:DUF4145 domain-containing protein [Methylobacterium sp. J-077]MCJ2125101.1 DUF4145 domain-containing protein [Methylobacterium sp. J-077]
MNYFALIGQEKPFQWTCEFCNRSQVATTENAKLTHRLLDVGKSLYGKLYVGSYLIRCLGSECNQVTYGTSIFQANIDHNGNFRLGSELAFWQLLPESSAKFQPDYIPKPLRDDYLEACRIKNLSPKASATLSRRCLQGMIRDFCNISRGRLIDEIKALRKAIDEGAAPAGVTSETVDAIDSVREVGNIGAHMEKDINVIVDVDPDEAQILIELIELLFEDWYVARNARQQRLAKVTALSAAKTAQLEAAKLAALPKPETP